MRRLSDAVAAGRLLGVLMFMGSPARRRLRWGAGLAVASLLVMQSASVGAATADVAAVPSCVPTVGGAPTRPTLAIGSASTAEGDRDHRKLWFAVTLSKPAPDPVSICYRTTPMTAAAGDDFTAKTGTLTIDAGATSAAIAVAIGGDKTEEPNETFSVDVTSAAGAQVIRPRGTGTIVNDDIASGRRLSIGSASIVEGAVGARMLRFAVTLSKPSSNPVSAAYATGDSSARAGVDFEARSGMVTIPAGATSVALEVPVRGDTVTEPNERFKVRLSEPIGAVLGTARAIGSIVDDDGDLALPPDDPNGVPLAPVFEGACPTNIRWSAHVGEVPGQAILVVIDHNNFKRSWTPAEHAGTVGGEFTGLIGGPHEAVITRYVDSVVQEHHDFDVIVPVKGPGCDP